ncbi:hypothetical protein [Rummeliibacillus stabekisii]|uniref:DUF3888 domain-containing protein n=1 Tax=Rummeliibacillus stabekisii TaxID=241244 RepID=A0A143HCM5_9BACL|nr:hypothetical protein [Rummeliibacillus stabekisii]AMW99226.1 hypothetical protein ATY39_06955 [Rummeliibacillus stabekisii]
MKIKLFSSLLIMGLITVNPLPIKADTEFIPQNQSPSVMEQAFIRELGPSILEALSENGKIQLFDSARIEKVIRNKQKDQYDVAIRAIGYEGALNPPYNLIRITFRIPGDNLKNKTVVFFEQKRITPEEAKKLSEHTD